MSELEIDDREEDDYKDQDYSGDLGNESGIRPLLFRNIVQPRFIYGYKVRRFAVGGFVGDDVFAQLFENFVFLAGAV